MTEQTFSDPIAHGYYLQGESEISTTQSADAILQKADALARQDSRANLMHAACYYLAAAHFLETHDPAKSAHAYHQAGHQLQQLDQFIHAARAFLQAGTWAEQAAGNGAVRSYSRANHCFAEAGELDESESAYLKERDARVAWAKMQGKHPLALLAWKTTSNYGTSIPRWTAWILGTIMLFSLLYEVFFRVQWLQPMSNTKPSAWIPLWSGLYYAINVTSSLALVEYQPTHPIAQAIVMLNVIAGYLFLGIGIGIVGQIIKNR
jgi:hypothetical protein